MAQTKAIQLLHKMRDKAGTGAQLAEILYGGSAADPNVAYRSLHFRAVQGNIVRYLELPVRKFCDEHGIEVDGDVFLTERQRKNRAAAMAAQ